MAEVTTVDPAVETASEAGRAIADPTLLVAVATPVVVRRAPPVLPFAARFQGILIVVMLVGFVMILQQLNKQLYVVGLPIMVVAAFLQIAFGNIPPRSDFKKSLALLALTWGIVAAVFVISIQIAPFLISLGQNRR